jgi:ketosteroid isomerase-like protein
MRGIWAALLGAWLMATPAAAQVDQADRAAIEAAIRGQMDAFGRDDAHAAYGFAAPNIHALFPSAEMFLEMVRRAYAPVYRPQDARFRPPEATEDGVRQSVILRGPDGRYVTAIYTMQRQPDGAWKIAGCTLVSLPDTGA